MSIEKSNYRIGNRTRVLPACSVPTVMKFDVYPPFLTPNLIDNLPNMQIYFITCSFYTSIERVDDELKKKYLLQDL
jgi:hypothetical protein